MNEKVKHRYLSQLLSSNGDGTGSTEMIGNYTEDTRFYVAPPAGQKFYISRLLVFIEDVGAFDSGAYGKDVVLTRGIHLHLHQNGDTTLLTPEHVFTNSHWGQYCYDISLHSFGGGQVNGVMLARWSFFKAIPLGIDSIDADMFMLHEGDRLSVHLYDDFSDLVGHRMLVQGTRIFEA